MAAKSRRFAASRKRSTSSTGSDVVNSSGIARPSIPPGGPEQLVGGGADEEGPRFMWFTPAQPPGTRPLQPDWRPCSRRFGYLEPISKPATTGGGAPGKTLNVITVPCTGGPGGVSHARSGGLSGCVCFSGLQTKCPRIATTYSATGCPTTSGSGERLGGPPAPPSASASSPVVRTASTS